MFVVALGMQLLENVDQNHREGHQQVIANRMLEFIDRLGPTYTAISQATAGETQKFGEQVTSLLLPSNCTCPSTEEAISCI